MSLPLASSDSAHHQPLYEQVAGQIAGLIEEGTFRSGERVPSIRKLSSQLQVSLNTVKEAYALLEDRRLIEARPQSGYYVRARLPEIPAGLSPTFPPLPGQTSGQTCSLHYTW